MNLKLKALGEKIHDAMVKHGSFGEKLGGSCAVCSHLFVREAKLKYGYDVEFKVVFGHAWTEYKGVIYDLTARQFNEEPKVLICPRDRIVSTITSNYLRDRYQTKDIRTLDWVNSEWPVYQKPENYAVRWLNQHAAKIIYRSQNQ